MRIYTVHEPPRRDDELVAHTARFQFVRDGFHFWAFLLAPLWMLRHRLWLEFLVYLLLVGALTFALRQLGIAEGAGGWVWLALALLVGLEASSMLRWKLARRGYDNLGVVAGANLEDAERRFFDGWAAEPERAAPTAPAPGPSPFDRPAPS